MTAARTDLTDLDRLTDRLTALSNVADEAATLLLWLADGKPLNRPEEKLGMMAAKLAQATLDPVFPAVGTRVSKLDRAGVVTEVTRLRGGNLCRVKWDDGNSELDDRTAHGAGGLKWNNKPGLPPTSVATGNRTAAAVKRTGVFPDLS